MKGELLRLLPRDRAHAVSVGYLAARLGLKDREVRALLEELVTVDHRPVCTLPTANGVWLATRPEDVDLAVAQLRSRAGALLRRCRGLRLAREELAWSPTLFGE